MLSSLHIRNYVLIDSLDVDFPEGLSIITGQTGAGKSILLGALQLLLGARGDASLISPGAETCVVEGEFILPDGRLEESFSDAGVEWRKDRSLTIRRVLYSSGRSRSFINDSPVNGAILKECAAQLLDIHSQNNNQILTDKRYQLAVLDHFAGNGSLLGRCRACWKELQGLEADKADYEATLAELEKDRSYNEARFAQLDQARLSEGELEELEAEQKQLANAEEIKGAFEGALAALDPEEGNSVDFSLKEAGRLLDKVSAYVPRTGGLAERLRSARIELDDIRSSIEEASGRIDISEGRLRQVEDRMGLLYDLMHKFACDSVAGLIAMREEYSSKIFDSTSLGEKLSEVTEKIGKKRKEYSSICEELHDSRSKSAPLLAGQLEGSLHFLELENAAFEVEVLPAESGPLGTDGVLFAFSSSGAAPVDVAKCASGGEVSRIMLCLKAVMARFTGMPTMIFDEIDTGVSGSAADKMGRMICGMGADMQVIAITHLPQVAAKGDAHFVVVKDADSSSIRRVQGEDRVMEIARLLSGASITPQAVANAESLLGRS